MKLMDVHKDVKDYLETRCYCPYEVYDDTGLFYRLFHPEQECEIVCMCDDMFAVTAKPFKNESNPDEVVLFYLKEEIPAASRTLFATMQPKTTWKLQGFWLKG